MFSKTTIWAALLLVVYLLNGIFLIPQSSLTYDEMDHWSYGKRILKIQPQRVYPFDDASTMPISGLNAIPRAIEQLADPSLQKSDAGFSDILHGRYVTLLLCLLTGILIWQWSRELFGEWAGLASLFLYVFCPNLNAHGTLLTTDAYAALFSLATFYSLWRFIQVSNWKRFFLFAICLSISQVVKPSLLHLLLLSGVVCFVVILYRGQWKKNWKKQLLRVGIISLLILVVINLAFFFQGTGRSLDAYTLQSQTFKNLQAGIGSSLALPFPVPFIEGIDLTMFMNQLGAGHPEVSGPNYLLGETRTGNGFWHYYFISFLFKTPLSVLLLLLGLPVVLWKMPATKKEKWTILLLLTLSFYFLLVFGLTNRSQVGIRHVLMVYPLLYVALGYWGKAVSAFKWKGVLLVGILLYTGVSYYRFYPNLIAYHNELVADKRVYTIMASSNVDFGQSAFRLYEFLNNNPEYRIPDSIPQPGKYIQGVDAYLGLMDKYKIDWLNDHFKPIGQFDHSFLLFEVTEAELRQKGIR